MASVNSVPENEGAARQLVGSETKTVVQKNNQDKLPQDNIKSRFSWKKIDGVNLPYIIRPMCGKHIMFVSTWMAEDLLLKKYLPNVQADIYTTCTSVKGFEITALEAKVLNYINNKHYRKNHKYSAGKDYIVQFQDLYHFYTFLEVCYKKLLCNDTSGYKDKCGFICIDSVSLVPYCTVNGKKYIPIFFFEGETEYLRESAMKLIGWNLAYLKFCCKLMGVKSEWFGGNFYIVVDLDDVKSVYPPETDFEDIWSTQKSDSYFFDHQSKHKNMQCQWFKTSPDVGININSIDNDLVPLQIGILQRTEVMTNPMLQQEKEEEQQQQQINTTTPLVQAHDNSKNAAYKVQMTTIEGKAIHCINAEPYIYSDLMVTLKDLVRIMLPSCNVAKCAHVLHKYLKTTLLFGNLEQLALLLDNGLIRSMIPGDTPMVMLKDITQVLPQLKLLVLLQDETIEKII